MYHKSICLSGEWRLILQEIGKGKLDQVLKACDQSMECMVPGDIHIALTKAGLIKDPLVDRNNEECRWLEDKEFWYIKAFSVDRDFIRDLTELSFDGLDLTSDIWLNGEYIGSHNNAFIGVTFDVSSQIREGENVLAVRIDDGINFVKERSAELMQHSWNNDQPYRAWMRKPQYVYGWDWTIWLPTCGIWKDVILRSYDKGCIRDCYVKTRFSGDRITAAEEIALEIAAEIEILAGGKYILECELYEDGRYDRADGLLSRETKEITADKSGVINSRILHRIEKPRLWWPNGTGLPYLYELRVNLFDEQGQMLHSIVRRHGLRSVSLEEKELGEGARSFTFLINDNPVFVKGANHVPADCLLGRITDEKNRALLQYAAAANMNMIRVWGGGIYESESFMDACDELGLMVWQDFMFACGFYPDYDPDFYKEVSREAIYSIKRLRNHTSLVCWAGNNEIHEMYASVKNYHGDLPWYGIRFYKKLLPGLVKRLCPDRIYRESSPYGGEEPVSYEEGDQHTWHFTHRPEWEHYLDLWHFTDFDFKFLSEFGIIGAMNMEAAEKCIRKEALNPASPEWLHHTNSTSGHQILKLVLEKYFGDCSQMGLQEYILRSQVLQAEIMRHIYDDLRARKFRCSGVLLWTLSDTYGINNWSVIDYYLGKRPVYYYLKRALAPFGLVMRGYEVQSFQKIEGYSDYYKGEVQPVEITVVNDLLEEREILLEYKIMTFEGRVLKSGLDRKTIKANSAVEILSVDYSDIKEHILPEETLLYAQLSDGDQVLNENRYFFTPYCKLKLKAAVISCRLTKSSDTQVELQLETDSFVWMLHLATPDGVRPEDNDFDLYPGKVKRISIDVETAESFVPEFFSLNPGLTVELV